MVSSNPLDDDAQAVEPQRRTRRPWWRWNLITIACVLFSLTWLRVIFDWSPASTWLGVLTVFFLWAIVPAFLVPTFLTSHFQTPGDAGNAPEFRAMVFSWRNIPLLVFRIAALVLVLFSAVHLGMILYSWSELSQFTRMGRGWSFRYVMEIATMLALPLLEFVLAGCLYVLTEIALRLDRR